jgi:hypothetical protein
MKNWFTSLEGAVTLSAVAFVVFVARSLLDFQFVIGQEVASTTAQEAIAVLFYTALVGGWLWAMFAAARSSRAGLIAALLFDLVFAFGLGIGTLVSFCPSPCPTAGGLMETANWANLVTGLLAVVATGLYLRQSPAKQS